MLPRFFTYFHAPIFWGISAATVWVTIGRLIPWLQMHPRAMMYGLVLIGLSFGSWAYLHYRTRTAPRTPPPPANEIAPLGRCATEKGFYIGTIGHSYNIEELEGVIGVHFNSITPAFDMKWDRLLIERKVGQYDFSRADRFVDYALEQGVRVRGHPLVWGKDCLPADLPSLVKDSAHPVATLKDILHDHIDTVLSHFKDRILEWDVVNEPLDTIWPCLDHNLFYTVMGESYIDFVFSCARAVLPAGRLFINEQLWNYRNRHARCFLELLGRLKGRNVPFDGVGIQSHVNIPPPPTPELFRGYLERIARLNVDIEITEFDALLRFFPSEPNPYQAQAEYYRSMLEVCLSVPACRGFTVWGLCDANSWYGNSRHFKSFGPHAPYLFDETMKPKLAYLELQHALINSRRRPTSGQLHL